MEQSNKDLCFFLGANSAAGFYSMFDQIYDPHDGWRGYIIKGGPGTGKSGLMRKVGMALEAEGHLPVWIYCSSDSDSLDAIIFPGLKFFMLDGTSPHCMDPKYPGAVESILNLGDCWDKELLTQKRARIIEYSSACSAYHAQSDRFIAAAGMLKSDSYRLVFPLVDEAKTESYAKRLVLGNFKGKKGAEPGKEYKALLSGITPKGVVCFEETAEAFCDTIYIIEDNYGPVSNFLLRNIKDNFLRLGADVISCWCPLFPEDKLEHLIVPEYNAAFMTSDYSNKLSLTPSKRINPLRFIDTEALKACKPRLRFNKRAASELLEEAIHLQKMAKNVHDKLEQCYIQSMNFKKVDQYAEKIIQELL